MMIADHQPFYCQTEAYRREGIDLDRTMLGNWAGRGVQLAMSLSLLKFVGQASLVDDAMLPS